MKRVAALPVKGASDGTGHDQWIVATQPRAVMPAVGHAARSEEDLERAEVIPRRARRMAPDLERHHSRMSHQDRCHP